MDITINGVVTTPEGIDDNKFGDEFIEWLESKGYYFGGGIGPYNQKDNARFLMDCYKDNYHTDEEDSKLKPAELGE